MERLNNLPLTDIQVLAAGAGLIVLLLVITGAQALRGRRLAKRMAAAHDATAAELAEARALTQAAIERRQQVETKYGAVLNADEEAKRITDCALASAEEIIRVAEEKVADLSQTSAKLANDIEALRRGYKDKKVVFDRLEAQMALYDERLSFAELGIYEPHFEFSDSEQYRERIVQIRDRQ